MKESKDILVVFENLNNHEVFTPPRIAKDMLDLLPKEIWSNPEIKLLDPCVKTGVFLRESFYRFFDGLKDKGAHVGLDGKEYNLNNKQELINHILKNMLFGIATSELTGYIARRTLYGVMKANSNKENNAFESMLEISGYDSWSENKQERFFDDMVVNDYFDNTIFSSDKNYNCLEEEGNIFYPTDEVQKKVIEEDNYEIEDTYYPFIEENVKHKKIKEILENKMKFDVIIGNPPYQISQGESSAKPIYHKFIEQAINLNSKYISMITPSRWMQGGKGLENFRLKMLNDKRLIEIVDFHNAADCFPSVNIEGGINYFLWGKEHKGLCKYSIDRKDKKTRSKMLRKLNDFDFLIRNNDSIKIIKKIIKNENKFLSSKVSTQTPFGILTSFKNYKVNKFNKSIKIYGNKKNMKDTIDGTGYIELDDITRNQKLINIHKVLIPAANGSNNIFQLLSKTFYAEPNSVCSQTYLIVDIKKTKKEAENLIKYLNTKFVAFLLKQLKISQHASAKIYTFVPDLDMNITWTDEMLYKKYNLTQEEIDYIETSIKEMK